MKKIASVRFSTAQKQPRWEWVTEESDAKVRRLKVDGGWLYQVQTGWKCTDYNLQSYSPTFAAPPVFVAETRNP